MHIQTKFIVGAAPILSVLLSGMSITYAANASKIKQELANEKARIAQAQIAREESAASLEREKQGLLSSMATLQQERNDLASSRDALRGDVARLQAEVNKMQLLTVTHEARIDEFRAVIETNTEIMKAQSDELVSIREQLLRKTQGEIQLTDRINELTARNDALAETNRVLTERIAEMREGRSGGTSTADRPAGPAPSGFKARVTSVTSAGGGDLVQIDAGTSDGLRNGMKLDVVRNGSWVATILLSRVDLNEAIARIDIVGAGNSVQSGDTVQSQR